MSARIGIIGIGKMGSLHARVVASSPECTLAWVADPNQDAGQRIAEHFNSRWIPEADLGDVDAVIVAAPTQFHRDIAHTVIEQGLPLLLEKPMADTIDESRSIVEAARRRGSVLACGFLERFNPAVRTAADIAREPLYIATVRHSPRVPRITTGVASDLLIHDVDMVVRLVGDLPNRVTGSYGIFARDVTEPPEDVAEAMLGFRSGCVANLSASRISQRKVRTLVINEAERSIEVDLLRQAITVFRNVEGAAFDEFAGYSQQTVMEIPVIRHTGEPLQLQLTHFLNLLTDDALAEAEIQSVLPPHEVLEQIRHSSTIVA